MWRMLKRFDALVVRLLSYQQQLLTHTRATHVRFNTRTAPRFQKRTMATNDAPAEITAAPVAKQLVEHNGTVFTTVREGSAYILVPPDARTSADPKGKSKAGEHFLYNLFPCLAMPLANAFNNAGDGSESQNVFYNPIQQFNRDLSVLAIKAFGEDLSQRKRQRHEQLHEKHQKKQERKRKRKHAAQEGEVTEEGGVKARRTGDGSSIAASDEVAVAENGESSVAATEQAAADAEETEERGVAVAESDEANDATKSATTSSQQAANEPSSSNGVSHGNPNNNKPQQPWRPKFRILDALSATGLRALRYASEIPSATEVVANDRDRNAVRNINANVEHNKLASAITATTGDALGHMYGVAFPPQHSHGPNHMSGKYDVIDLDPYGTAAPFIDAALQALEDGGLLCVTSTDSGVFASCGYSEKTFSLYGGMPIKGLHSHEGGLRLVLLSIATTASKYGLAMEPLLSLSIDFYVRLFIRVRKSPHEVKFLAGKSMLVYECDHGCGAWSTQFIGRHMKHKNSETNWKFSIAQGPSADQLCEHCGSKTHIAGPMWGGPLHNPVFIEKILSDLENADQDIYQTKKRIEGMLDTALDELVVNADAMDLRSVPAEHTDSAKEIIPKTPPEAIDHHPFFFIPSALCKVIKAVAPPENMVKGALRHAGYRVTRSHCKPGSIKTDAPWTVIWEVMREWVRQKSPIKEGALQEILPGWKILQATRQDDKDGESNGAPNGNGTENSSTEATPDVVTEIPNGNVPKPKPTDLKRMKVVFDEKLGKDRPGKRLVRYQENPRENWGPMRRAKGNARDPPPSY